jgi:Xaa-Pro dipeptidase
MIDISEIQHALKQEGVDGWLFFDHHHRDPLAYHVLKLGAGAVGTRRWYYFIPTEGEPKRLVHRIESGMLDPLPGEKIVYAGWESQVGGIRKLLGDAKRVAMQYSPNCAIPYVSMVDGGTVELVRGVGVEVVSSANLIQIFEAKWTSDQLQLHLEAGRRVDRIRGEAFNLVGNALRTQRRITEWDINRFIREAFKEDGLVTDHGPIVAVNANMSNPHYEPEADHNSEIHKGDAFLIDMWAKLDQSSAVYYDITWTGFCDVVIPPAIANVFDVVRTARDRAVERVRSAVASRQTIHGFEVDDAARGYIAERGFGEYFVHRTGHSIGEEVHGTGANMDNLETHDERVLIPGTCFSIEPGVYLPDFGIRLEVNVYVGEDEARVTGEVQTEMIRV